MAEESIWGTGDPGDSTQNITTLTPRSRSEKQPPSYRERVIRLLSNAYVFRRYHVFLKLPIARYEVG